MRPAFLNPLFASAQTLAGHRPAPDPAFEEMPGACRPALREPRVIDVLWHMPTGVIDRRSQPQLAAAVPGTIVTLELRVLKHKPSPRGNTKAPYKVTCEDDTGRIDLVFFHAEHKFIERQLPVGEIRYVSGRIERYSEKLQMAHPDYIVVAGSARRYAVAGARLSADRWALGKVRAQGCAPGLERVPELPEWQDTTWLEQRDWPNFKEAALRVSPAGRGARRLERRRALATPRLRRTPGGSARIRARTAEPQDRTRPPPFGQR